MDEFVTKMHFDKGILKCLTLEMDILLSNLIQSLPNIRDLLYLPNMFFCYPRKTSNKLSTQEIIYYIN